MNNLRDGALIAASKEDSLMANALAAGAALAKPVFIDHTPVFVIPEGYEAKSFERMLSNPIRKRGKFILRNADSFIDYFKTHQINSNIYGSIDPPKFIAVLDDHVKDDIGWREHLAIYECPISVEWKTWTAANKKGFKQAEFAQFIEDNLPDIVEPSGADMLEISRTLEAKKKINFASGIRLANGQNELTYEEDIQGTAGKGKLQIPETFAIGVPVLEGGPRYKVTARLRYRIDGGALVIWFDLLRPHKVIEDAVIEVWKEIETETGVTIFNGTPDLTA